jgi:hypothetical protein
VTVQYLHGIETIELDSPSGPVETVKSNVIGLVGTAPDADPDLFPLNTPVAVFADALKAGQLKSAGTLLDAVDAIYSQKSAVIVVTRVAEGQSQPGRDLVQRCRFADRQDRHLVAAQGASDAQVIPKLLIAPGLTSGRPTNGLKNLVIGRRAQATCRPRPHHHRAARDRRSSGHRCAAGGRRQADRRDHHRPGLRLRRRSRPSRSPAPARAPRSPRPSATSPTRSASPSPRSSIASARWPSSTARHDLRRRGRVPQRLRQPAHLDRRSRRPELGHRELRLRDRSRPRPTRPASRRASMRRRASGTRSRTS